MKEQLALSLRALATPRYHPALEACVVLRVGVSLMSRCQAAQAPQWVISAALRQRPPEAAPKRSRVSIRSSFSTVIEVALSSLYNALENLFERPIGKGVVYLKHKALNE